MKFYIYNWKRGTKRISKKDLMRVYGKDKIQSMIEKARVHWNTVMQEEVRFELSKFEELIIGG